MKVCPSCRLRYGDDVEFCLVDGEVLEAVQDPRIGHVLGGRYTLTEVIGRGGMATVYKAHHSLGRRNVAIKVLHDRFADDLSLHERFAREAEKTKSLAHPNIIEVYDLGKTDDGVPYLVMELLDGHPLDQVLRRRRQLAPQETIALGLQIARGLSRAHDFDVVHRDVKPENIFLCRSDDRVPVVKLVDFGIAIKQDDLRLTASGQMIGSPRYMAPERFRDKQVIIPASDLYAFGILLFEMATGKLPFESESMAGYLFHHMETAPPRLSSLVKDCPPELDRLVDELLAKEPSDRPVDAHAVVATLSSVATESAKRIRRVSALSQRVRASGLQLRMDAWAARARTYSEMLDRCWPEENAPRLMAERAAELNAAVARLRMLHKVAKSREEELGQLDAQLKLDRERIGHAIQALAEDLSRSKSKERDEVRPSAPGGGNWADAYRRALAAVIDFDMRHPNSPTDQALRALQDATEAYEKWMEAQKRTGLTDLGFQLEALRKRQSSLDGEARDKRERISRELTENGEERTRLEVKLVELSQDLSAALGGRPELADLFDRLRAGG
ncbi:MAG: protein kinase [Myxococcota bacterium]